MKVFITGMTGTLGTALAQLHAERGDEVVGCARDEDRCLRWRREHNTTKAVLIIGDARDILAKTTEMGKELGSCHRLYHCAALKHVDVCENDPVQAVLQNVNVTSVVAAACREAKVSMVLASSDKAFKPAGVYGATKLIAERIVLREGGAVVRLGNLIGSSGSVFKLWAEAVAKGELIKLTDPCMTRFFLSVREAASFMANDAIPGQMRWPGGMMSARMGDVADGVSCADPLVVGLRPGETMHQEIAEGVSSEHALRWNIEELLKESGGKEMNALDMILAAWDGFPGRSCSEQQWVSWMNRMLRAVEAGRKQQIKEAVDAGDLSER